MYKKYQSRKYRIILAVLLVILTGVVYTIYGLFIRDDTPASFLPLLELERNQLNQPVKKITCADYSIGLTKEGGIFLKYNKENNASEFFYYINYKDRKGKQTEEILSEFIVTYSDSSTLIIKCAGEIHQTVLTIKWIADSKALQIISETLFNNEIKLNRSALILLPSPQITAFTKKNGLIENQFDTDEYWIGKRGLIECGEGSGKYLLDGGSLSSIQVEVERNEIWLNADYYMDHPGIHIIKNGSGKWTDVSANEYRKGDSVISEFSILLGNELSTYPKLMTNPSGYLSALIFTEHADNTILETNKAVYFGSDQINNPEDAIGGFIKYKIPVTKSVFFSNVDKLNNLDFNSGIKDLQLAVIGNPAYIEFLKLIYGYGRCEIAFHTIDPSNDRIGLLDSAFSFLKNNFNVTTWIDHGMSDGFSNRESFSADGLDSNSENYMSDYWDKYGVKYFWNSSFEKESDCGSLKSKIMSGHIIDFLRCYLDRIIGNNDLLRSEDGEHIPAPVDWQNNTINPKFYSWGTLRSSGHYPGWIWNYVYREKKLNELVNDRGVNIVHFYPAFVGNKLGYNNGIIEKNGASYIINKDFDKMLERVSKYRDRQKINITTISDFMDYQIAKERVKVIPVSQNKYSIHNQNEYEIKGISFSVGTGSKIRINKKYDSKLVGEELIFWFDMSEGEKVEVEIE